MGRSRPPFSGCWPHYPTLDKQKKMWWCEVFGDDTQKQGLRTRLRSRWLLTSPTSAPSPEHFRKLYVTKTCQLHHHHVSRVAFFHIRDIARIRNISSQSDAKKNSMYLLLLDSNTTNPYLAVRTFIWKASSWLEKKKSCREMYDEDVRESSYFSNFSFWLCL